MNNNNIIKYEVANKNLYHFCQVISEEIEKSAKVRGTGIAKRSIDYILQKMQEEKAIIAHINYEEWVGFCYLETWSHGKYVANSGLIISPQYRQLGIAKGLKKRIFRLSKRNYPNAKFFGLTTSFAVMKINSELGYKPVIYSELTQDNSFWEGCKSCKNYSILISKNRQNCLCTAMLYDAEYFSKKKKQRQNVQKNIKLPSSK